MVLTMGVGLGERGEWMTRLHVAIEEGARILAVCDEFLFGHQEHGRAAVPKQNDGPILKKLQGVPPRVKVLQR